MADGVVLCPILRGFELALHLVRSAVFYWVPPDAQKSHLMVIPRRGSLVSREQPDACVFSHLNCAAARERRAKRRESAAAPSAAASRPPLAAVCSVTESAHGPLTRGQRLDVRRRTAGGDVSELSHLT